jgi:hypothetical protein
MAWRAFAEEMWRNAEAAFESFERREASNRHYQDGGGANEFAFVPRHTKEFHWATGLGVSLYCSSSLQSDHRSRRTCGGLQGSWLTGH